jgi:hypothetical protein
MSAEAVTQEAVWESTFRLLVERLGVRQNKKLAAQNEDDNIAPMPFGAPWKDAISFEQLASMACEALPPDLVEALGEQLKYIIDLIDQQDFSQASAQVTSFSEKLARDVQQRAVHSKEEHELAKSIIAITLENSGVNSKLASLVAEELVNKITLQALENSLEIELGAEPVTSQIT